MTNSSLAQSYLKKAEQRLRILKILQVGEDYSEVIREAQEAVDLCTKAMLRQAGIEPPKWHDIGGLLLEHRKGFASEVREALPPVWSRSPDGCGRSGIWPSTAT